MPTRLVQFNGTEFNVEVDDLEAQIAHPTEFGDLLGRGLTETGVLDRVADAGTELRQMLAAVTSSISQAMEKSKPKEWSVELSVGFKGESGVPCLTKGEANASIKLTAKWSNPL